ncbi:MAG: altronate dehydratase, partial [Pseudomonadota bacterium]
MTQTIRLDPTDNVATARQPLEVGAGGATQLIPRGHKMATEAIPKGAPVRKYAQIIGYAAEDIPKG